METVCADGNCLESKQYLLKPDASDVISPKATRVHGITTKVANDLGGDRDVVLDEFITILRKVPNDGFVVAHDMKVVDAIIAKSLNPEQQIVWNVAPKCDTYSLQLAEKYLPSEIKAERYRDLLMRKIGFQLSELHFCPFITAHVSLQIAIPSITRAFSNDDTSRVQSYIN